MRFTESLGFLLCREGDSIASVTEPPKSIRVHAETVVEVTAQARALYASFVIEHGDNLLGINLHGLLHGPFHGLQATFI